MRKELFIDNKSIHSVAIQTEKVDSSKEHKTKDIIVFTVRDIDNTILRYNITLETVQNIDEVYNNLNTLFAIENKQEKTN